MIECDWLLQHTHLVIHGAHMICPSTVYSSVCCSEKLQLLIQTLVSSDAATCYNAAVQNVYSTLAGYIAIHTAR